MNELSLLKECPKMSFVILNAETFESKLVSNYLVFSHTIKVK